MKGEKKDKSGGIISKMFFKNYPKLKGMGKIP